jgi:serine/threonine-protein kinase
MSPEQATGATLDERADVWSLCVVLYEGLARRPAFVGDTPTQVLQSVLRDEPAPLEGVDHELARIVFNGLSKDRASRTPSLQRLRDELSAWLTAHDMSDDSASPRGAAGPHRLPTHLDSEEDSSPRRRRGVVPVAAVAVLLLLATGTWAAVSTPPPSPPPPVAVVPPRTAEPVVLAAPPDFSSPPLPRATTAEDDVVVEERASPPAVGRPAATPRAAAKGRSPVRPTPKDPSWAAINRYGI